ncbi:hypothetical protein CALVIDRAFT_600976 [Calocera viscosa TUFC12733]|uniref:Uncharacterized protein n=1 Tax=Calocera viscosa (strain TUFC12733) TaxID=1330018 RepID=A0A167IX40_CALVF|nr:hypothetical protein CALVIDRAFT_600976 [Calocera viscosa TUFC12733]
MPAFDALTNLIQTIHDPPETFVLLSHVSNYSWQLKLFLIASELKCYASTKCEEISRDRKLVARDKEAAFKDWKTLADFIGSKIVAGDLHVTGWGTTKTEVIIDPGRPSSLTIPLTELDGGDAAATATDLIYMIANDARQTRRCALIPPTAPANQINPSPASTSKSIKSTKIQSAVPVPSAEEEELAKLKAELAAKEDELAREKARPKAENARPVAAPPKAVAGASTAMPGHARRIIKRAQFSDDEEEEESRPKGRSSAASASKTSEKKPEHTSAIKSKPTKPPAAPPKRALKRPEFDTDDEDADDAMRAKSKKPNSLGAAVASSSKSVVQSMSQTKPKARPATPVKRVARRAEFEDDEDEGEDGGPVGKKRKT